MGGSGIQQSAKLLTILVVALTAPLAVGFVADEMEPDSTVAGPLVFGVPDDVVESLIGQYTRVVDVISLDVGNGWVSGDSFLRGLEGRLVVSGNAYRVVSGCRAYDLENPCQQDDVLTEGGVHLPLMVIETQEDLRLVFNRNNRTYETYYGLNEPSPDQPTETWPGRTGAVPYLGFIGPYALENGVMEKTVAGGWAPFPLDENGRLRIQDQEYAVSLVYVYAFPFDPLPILAFLVAVAFLLPGAVAFGITRRSKNLFSSIRSVVLTPSILGVGLAAAWLAMGAYGLLFLVSPFFSSGTVYGLFGIAGILWSKATEPQLEVRRYGPKMLALSSLAVILLAFSVWYFFVWRSLAF